MVKPFPFDKPRPNAFSYPPIQCAGCGRPMPFANEFKPQRTVSCVTPTCKQWQVVYKAPVVDYELERVNG